MPLNKYLDFIPVSHTLIFMREPLSQIKSHYNHHVNKNELTESFDVFYQKNNFVNVQSRYLQGLPISLIGYVGITEKYSESLALINDYLECNIPCLSENESPTKHVGAADLSPSDKEAVLALNARDVLYYQQALQLHQQRHDYHQQGKEWTYLHCTVHSNNALFGCAYYQKSDDAVEFTVYINGQPWKKSQASNFFGGFPKANFPRERYIGFYMPLPERDQLNIKSIMLKVVQTGQEYYVEL